MEKITSPSYRRARRHQWKNIRSTIWLPTSTRELDLVLACWRAAREQEFWSAASTASERLRKMAIERPTLTLTTSWDDGHPLDFRIAGLLAKHGLRGTFYVPLENSRPTLTAPQIRELSQSFEIGAHTVHHFVLTTLPDDQAKSEIMQSKARLEDITGKPCLVFCFPKGRYGNAHIKMLGEAGFAGARTVELMSLDRPRAEHSVPIMPTTLQACPNSTLAYLRNAVKRFRYEALWNLLLHNHGADWAA